MIVPTLLTTVAGLVSIVIADGTSSNTNVVGTNDASQNYFRPYPPAGTSDGHLAPCGGNSANPPKCNPGLTCGPATPGGDMPNGEGVCLWIARLGEQCFGFYNSYWQYTFDPWAPRNDVTSATTDNSLGSTSNSASVDSVARSLSFQHTDNHAVATSDTWNTYQITFRQAVPDRCESNTVCAKVSWAFEHWASYCGCYANYDVLNENHSTSGPFNGSSINDWVSHTTQHTNEPSSNNFQNIGTDTQSSGTTITSDSKTNCGVCWTEETWNLVAASAQNKVVEDGAPASNQMWKSEFSSYTIYDSACVKVVGPGEACNLQDQSNPRFCQTGYECGTRPDDNGQIVYTTCYAAAGTQTGPGTQPGPSESSVPQPPSSAVASPTTTEIAPNVIRMSSASNGASASAQAYNPKTLTGNSGKLHGTSAGESVREASMRSFVVAFLVVVVAVVFAI